MQALSPCNARLRAPSSGGCPALVRSATKRAMAIHDFSSQRLYVESALGRGAQIVCEDKQANYLLNVLRLKPGSQILIFNGRDGEWKAEVASSGKRACALIVVEQTRPQTNGPDVDYLFAPLKHARLDYMVQKAAEMGVRRLRPIMTRRTVAERVNLDRMRANVIEAVEQCGIVHVAEVAEPVKLDSALSHWDAARTLIFCDESAPEVSAVEALLTLPKRAPIAVLIGPEGGFDPNERDRLLALPFTLPVSLGPRIMRADTAAVAALALVNAIHGNGW